MVQVNLKIVSCPNKDFLHTNCVYANPQDVAFLSGEGASIAYIEIKSVVYVAVGHATVEKGNIGLSGPQRESCLVSIDDVVPVLQFKPHKPMSLGDMTVEVDLANKNKNPGPLDVDVLQDIFRKKFKTQYFHVNQKFTIELTGTILMFRVTKMNIVTVGELGNNKSKAAVAEEVNLGQFTETTDVFYGKAPGSTVTIAGGEKRAKEVFRPDFNFEKLGIGGLDDQFGQIFRRAFASRLFPVKVIQKLGINHVRGILLYGPPGTGKTLIARQISRMLNGKEPKIVNGPEVLSKYVGQTEENVRKLFYDAEQEYKERGDESDLHVIIFDEIDAICKSRGSTRDNTGVHDTLVNQLLSKIDGVDALNNILLIGMTNRKDMLDEALLRPGRLEVHIEISLPDEHGRQQILAIHTRKMRESGFMGDSVDLGELARQTKNFTGAEIEGLCKSAVSFALNRQVNVEDLGRNIDANSLRIEMEDFLRALTEVQPAFGTKTNDFTSVLVNGFIGYGPRFERLKRSLSLYVEQVRRPGTPVLSVLLEGPNGTGKTSLASKAAMLSEFPFAKMITPKQIASMTEQGRCSHIVKVFDDASKSPLSVVVLDNIERLIEYVPIGPRFNNSTLQTILTLIKEGPPEGHRLLVIATTSSASALESLGVLKEFDEIEHIPLLDSSEVTQVLEGVEWFEKADAAEIASVFKQPIGIKQLFKLLHRARGEGMADFRALSEVVAATGYSAPDSDD
eukprot:TRINITY_DN68_c0_g1::TRINITY_DN68_c0_g1_i1::g.14766::m.14766 TRINITY_DN68_c0_g1::TRINITY_DN68_c0_g1_i1::g.14766  ORF type:complete len:735 (+),score=266.55,sp/Q9M0Y8/NSF_ARATH/46.05/0.0,AAA/PF00004.24/8e-39,AAA/PF00004.24/6.5e-12,AAA_22/PF13401.1/0.00036,AAA_22/PF13401.1/0.16,AAA_5/PF07728.9/4.1e-05,AAA_5/PF07728.9/0.065,AAA_2/PF07724.9/1.8e-06,AAA_2/PF07724.9/1.3,CDC48_N/PF02359.13/1.6e-08,CDC48_N/PF02359.13/1.4e+03,AAA_16/PF13191.1/0.003,AAA_16/PF13191.1/0.088,Mg_chelatase/PF01078.16/0.0036,Mg_